MQHSQGTYANGFSGTATTSVVVSVRMKVEHDWRFWPEEILNGQSRQGRRRPERGVGRGIGHQAVGGPAAAALSTRCGVPVRIRRPACSR